MLDVSVRRDPAIDETGHEIIVRINFLLVRIFQQSVRRDVASCVIGSPVDKDKAFIAFATIVTFVIGFVRKHRSRSPTCLFLVECSKRLFCTFFVEVHELNGVNIIFRRDLRRQEIDLFLLFSYQLVLPQNPDKKAYHNGRSNTKDEAGFADLRSILYAVSQ